LAKPMPSLFRVIRHLFNSRQERFRSLALLKGDASGLGIAQGRDCLIANGSRYHPDLQLSPYYSDTITCHHALPSLSNNIHALFDFHHYVHQAELTARQPQTTPPHLHFSQPDTLRGHLPRIQPRDSLAMKFHRLQLRLGR